MNALKNLALILVVGGVGYLVYQHLYGPTKPNSSETASGSAVPKVEVPGLDRSGAGKNSAPASGNVSPPGGTTATQPASQFLPASRTVPASSLPDPDQKKTSSAASDRTPLDQTNRRSSDAGSAGGNSSSPAMAGESATSEAAARTQGAPSRSDRTTQAAPTNRRPDHEIGEQFLKCMQVAQEALRQGEWTGVLIQLSPWYQHPELTRAESEKLTELLDQLAGSVIYSREHRLAPPYRVRPGDNLVQIARQYQVSWELLAKINGIRDPSHLEGIETIKVVRGPFHALVDLTRREMTLMLEFQDAEGQSHPLYAGRFPIRALSGVSDLEGQYEVLRKSPGPRAQESGPLALELSQQVIIHGPTGADSPPKSRGSIELPQADMDDIYDILTIGSRVLIRR